MPKDTPPICQPSAQPYRLEDHSEVALAQLDSEQEIRAPTIQDRSFPPRPRFNPPQDSERLSPYDVETTALSTDLPAPPGAVKSPVTRERDAAAPEANTDAEEIQCSPLQVLAEAVARHHDQIRPTDRVAGNSSSPRHSDGHSGFPETATSVGFDSGQPFVGLVRDSRLSRYFGKLRGSVPNDIYG